MKKVNGRCLAAVAASILALAGCTEKPRVLRLHNWFDYISPQLIAAFERQYDCVVEVSTFDSNEDMILKMREDGCESYDLIVPSSYVVSQMAQMNLIVPIDHARCPSVKRNIDPNCLYAVPEDRELRYGVPYAISSSGLLYATNRIPVGVDVNTWALLGNPALRGRVTLLDDMREVIGAALMSLGYSVNSENEREINAAVEQVLKWIPNVNHWATEDYKSDIRSGQSWLGQAYGPNSLQLILGNDEMPPRPDIAITHPKEGFVTSCEVMVVSSGCKDVDLAYAFIDFLYSNAEAVRANMRYIYCEMPMVPALVGLDPEFRKLLELSPEERGRTQVLKGFYGRSAVEVLYERAWERIVRER